MYENFDVLLERTATGSFVVITVRATNKKEARSKAREEMPGWKVLNAKTVKAA